MQGKTLDLIQVGTEIKALLGVFENLEGKVLEINGGKLYCEFKGLTRSYKGWVNLDEVVSKQIEEKVIPLQRDLLQLEE